MEIYSNTTRFALACNLSNKIIEPIQSRCAILRYSKLADAEVMKRLQEIVEMENVCSFALRFTSGLRHRRGKENRLEPLGRTISGSDGAS